MQPLKPEEKSRIIEENPQADPGDLAEYERLLSQRFAMDPDVPAAPEALAGVEDAEARLAELHAKLFPEHEPVS